jgi:hypothetical protein
LVCLLYDLELFFSTLSKFTPSAMTHGVREEDENALYWQREKRDEVGQTSGACSPNTKLTLVRPEEMIVAISVRNEHA